MENADANADSRRIDKDTLYLEVRGSTRLEVMTHLVRVVAAARQIDVSKGEARYLAAVVLFGARKAYEGAGISRSHGTVLATRLRRKGVEVRDEEKIKKLWDLRKLSIIWRLPGDR